MELPLKAAMKVRFKYKALTTPTKKVRLMTHGAVFAGYAAESSRSSIASDGIRQHGSPRGGRFADCASRLLAVQRAV
jgi:hypothetical protein